MFACEGIEDTNKYIQVSEFVNIWHEPMYVETTVCGNAYIGCRLCKYIMGDVLACVS